MESRITSTLSARTAECIVNSPAQPASSAKQRLTAQVIPLPGAQAVPVQQMRRVGAFPKMVTTIRALSYNRNKALREKEAMRKKWDSLHVEYGFFQATIDRALERLDGIRIQIAVVRDQIDEKGGC